MIDHATAVAIAAARSDVDATAGCWIWRGPFAPKGYAVVSCGGIRSRVSRAVLGLANGDPRMALHSCDNPRCVNPSHLRVGDASANMRDAVARRRQNHAKKSHCPKGHPYDELNTIHGRSRQWANRRCRTCEAARKRRYRLRAAAEPASEGRADG